MLRPRSLHLTCILRAGNKKRGIPKAQVVGLKCPKTEEITRDDYEKTLAEPLRRTFSANAWWKLREPENPAGPVESNKIRFVA